MVDRPKLLKPDRITGCGHKFTQGEWAITWNHGGRPKPSSPFWYDNWGYDEAQYGHIFECGSQVKNCIDHKPNDTTYYCRNCLIKVGLLW